MTATAFDALNTAADTVRPEPERDRWGRYLITHPDTGKRQPWTRATTWASTVADTFGLTNWQLRMCALGLARRPDLLAQAATVADPDDPDAKKLLGRICDEAKEHAGASTRANLGTALHSFTEAHDLGRPLEVPAPYDADVAAYAATMAAAGVTIDLAHVERIVTVPELGVAGTFDRLVTLPDGRLLVADLKTGRDLSYSWTEIAIQLAIYAHAQTIYDPATGLHEPMPAVDRTQALVMHLPVGQARCTLHLVDIAAGWGMAQTCGAVRAWRRRDLAVNFTPLTPAPVEVAPPVDRAAWLQQRIAALAGNDTAVAHVRANWPGHDGVGHPAAPPWTDQQIDDIAAVLTAAEALVAAPFPTHSDPAIARPPAPPIVVAPAAPSTRPPWEPGDEGAAVDAEGRRAVTAAVPSTPDELTLVQTWLVQATEAGRPIYASEKLTTERGAAIAIAACRWAIHGDRLARAAIANIKNCPLEPQWTTGACLGSLTVDEARLLTQIADAAASDRTVLDELAAHPPTGDTTTP